MLERSPTARPDENATQLFAEYLAARDSGEPLDVDGLCARAGANAEELRRRIRALSVLDDLGDALREDDDGGDDALMATAGAATIPRLGPYENLRLLGEGGLSRVYVAYDPGLQREVALKVIASEQITRGAAHEWMLREGRSVARLQHPNVVRIFALGQTDDATRTYVAMELVDGPSLAEVREELRARKRGGAPASRDPRVLAAADRYAGIGARASLALRIARALAACHAADVLHRDVKPGNVLLDRDGEPKLIDFGLAHLSQDGAGSQHVTQRLIGTPAYVAPEQVESGMTGADPRSDQFSFGVLLYDLLTLEAPFQRGTRTQTLDAVARALPVAPRERDPAIPADLETICLHALEREPGDRYPSMDALADDLEAFLDHRAIAVSAPSFGRRTKLWLRRNRRDLLLFVGVGSLLALGAGIYQFVALGRERRAWTAEFERERAAVDKLVDPVQVQSAFMAAQSLESRGRELDRVRPASVFYERLAARAREQIQDVSSRLARRIAEGQDEARAAAQVARADVENDLFRAWEAALALDAALCPECPGNAVNRERGRVELPEPPAGTRLEVGRMRPGVIPMSVDFVPLEGLRTLGVGEFRVQWLDSDSRCLGEFDLQVRNRTRRATLILEPIPADIRRRFLHVPKGSVRIMGPEPVEVPEFWAHAGWFTAQDAAARASAKALTEDDSLEFVYGAPRPNLVPGQAAYAARGYSARLPTALQAARILELTGTGEVGFEPLPDGYAGEFCSGWAAPTGRAHLRHTPGAAAPYAFRAMIDGGSDNSGPYAFRLVTTRPPKP